MRCFGNTSGASKIRGLGYPDSLNVVFDMVDHSSLSGGAMIYCVMFYSGAGSGHLALDTIGFSTDDILHTTAICAIMQLVC